MGFSCVEIGFGWKIGGASIFAPECVGNYGRVGFEDKLTNRPREAPGESPPFQESVMARLKSPRLPQVACYHAEIHVQRGEQVLTLNVDLPDWAPENEIIQDLAMKYRAETMGDIVEALEKEGRVTVEPVGAGGFYCRGDRVVHKVEKRFV